MEWELPSSILIDILFRTDVFPDLVQDFAQDGLASREVGWLHLIEFVAQIEAAEIVLVAVWKRCIIQQPELALFSFGHIYLTISNCCSGVRSTTVQSFA